MGRASWCNVRERDRMQMKQQTKRKNRNNALFKDVANDGSTARDLLANERTFLAWIRTTISLFALGVALARIVPLLGGDKGQPRTLAQVTGLIMVITGIFTAVYGFWRYKLIEGRIMRGQFSIEKLGGIMLAVLVFVAGGLIVAIVVVAFITGDQTGPIGGGQLQRIFTLAVRDETQEWHQNIKPEESLRISLLFTTSNEEGACTFSPDCHK
ncbi:hypothetical protein PROFUN_07610 [Planoprotostelium fungivorum]|uniref:DUF202 domain-containing protein n=1 Tax=Planoprotostelium fungivorum TaxID=1890364 RepID=A0A2P6NK54_9EUKA|nr:hypothetical protein PROFUN_07610 [Planoprotostelium fungivorum]